MIRAPPLAVRVIGQPADRDREQADQSPEKDAQADEDHVGRDRRPVRVPELLRRPFDIVLGADQAQHIPPIDAGLGGERHRLPGPHEFPQEDPAGKLAGRQLPEGLPGQGLVRDHHVQELRGKIDKGLVVHFGADFGAPRHEDLGAGRSPQPHPPDE